jgi:sodium/hydrogen antiporter
MGFRPSTIAFMGWFGPRSPASITLALVVAEEEPELPAPGVILTAMTVTILASIALHGLSTVPSVRSYAREVERLPPSAAELRS